MNQTTIIDVRRVVRFNEATTMLPNAVWRDPSLIDQWATELDPSQAVLVYCVYGHEVSQNAALTLQSRGIQATYLEGGIDGWEKAGKPLVKKT